MHRSSLLLRCLFFFPALGPGFCAPALAQTPPATPPPAAATPPAPDIPDYSGAVWEPAAPGNFRSADRPASRMIDRIVIHDIEGSALSAVRWFQNPVAKVSAHYVVSGETGQVWQMVRERDVAYHAGDGDTNARSIGIEHEGFAYRPGFYDTTLYEASAQLVREITARYAIPRDRTHIIGHFEVPDPVNPGQYGGRSHHTDPGPYWDWDSFLTLVRSDARSQLVGAPPAVLHPGETATLTIAATNFGDDPWPVLLSAGEGGRVALTGREPVYLGVWPPPARLSIPVPLRSAAWTSPRLVGLPAGSADIAPGAVATFAFTVQAPPVAGGAPLVQQFRLMRVPAAPRPMVGFGSLIPVSVRIEPWEVIIPAAPGEAFTAGTGWHQSGAIFWSKAPASAAPACWTAPLPMAGTYAVYARWAAGPGRSAKAVYSITAADGAHTVLVDQRKPGGPWHLLGRYPFRDPATKTPAASILLSGQAPGVVVADAVRFVGPFAEEKE